VTESLATCLALAERAAREAGQLLADSPRREAPLEETAHDIRIRADRTAEDRIVAVLGEAGLPVVAEERVADGSDAASGGLRWIVDPLDGTANFVQSLPFCCVSIGLWRDDEPVLGVVYDFTRDEMFSGAAGSGARLNGAPVRVGSQEASRGVLCTGFPAGTDFAPDALLKFVAQVTRFRKIRLLGSAALSLAYVAAGRADAYLERDIRIWDVAAGLALVRAAGGEFLSAPSTVPHAFTIYAHNGICPWPDQAFR
jgi:myo-inositol-1(or 4)-monophosphatase